MPPEPAELVLGGQAVIEGVMMKGPLAYAVAVRKANGEIRVRDFPLVESAARKRIAKIPLVRGVVTMAAMLAIGYRALQFSADEAMEDAEGASAGAKGHEEGETSGGLAMAGAMAMALFMGVGLFFLLPLYATHLLAGLVPALRGSIAFNLADGVIRVVVFVLYIVGITRMKDIRRVFEYHGAEHKVINAYEGKADLTPEGGAGVPPPAPRCGTSCPPVRHGDQHPRLLLHPEGKLPADEGAPAAPADPGDRRNLLRGAAAVGEKDPVPLVPRARRAGDVAAAAYHPGAGPAPDRGGDRVVPACVGGAGVGGLPCGISSIGLGADTGAGAAAVGPVGHGNPREMQRIGRELAELRPVAAATPGTGRSSRSSPTTALSRTARAIPR